MRDFNTKPLIACVSTQPDFQRVVQQAATSLATDFHCSEDLRSTIQDRHVGKISCVLYDYENARGLDDQVVARQSREAWSLIVAVPQGDVKASFHAATRGAVNVIEKPMMESELFENLRSALASESRVSEFLNSEERRFSAPIFECLTKREKAILRLLMDGEPNKRVAAILDIGLRTVEADRAQTMKKLQVDSYVSLIKLVSRLENDVLNARKECFGNLLRNDRLVGNKLRETA